MAGNWNYKLHEYERKFIKLTNNFGMHHSHDIMCDSSLK